VLVVVSGLAAAVGRPIAVSLSSHESIICRICLASFALRGVEMTDWLIEGSMETLTLMATDLNAHVHVFVLSSSETEC